MFDEQERPAPAPEDDELAAAYAELARVEDTADDWTRGMLW